MGQRKKDKSRYRESLTALSLPFNVQDETAAILFYQLNLKFPIQFMVSCFLILTRSKIFLFIQFTHQVILKFCQYMNNVYEIPYQLNFALQLLSQVNRVDPPSYNG